MPENLFSISHNGINSAKGRVLIAEPFKQAEPFHRSVILITGYSKEKGAIGFILNKESQTSVNQLLPEFGEFNAPVFIGGPVETDYINFIHTLGDVVSGGEPLGGGLYWGGSFAELSYLASKGKVEPNQVLFFCGYSGWSLNQLEGEIKENAWLVTNLESHTIMDWNNKSSLWNRSLRHMGGIYQSWENYPEDPLLN